MIKKRECIWVWLVMDDGDWMVHEDFGGVE